MTWKPLRSTKRNVKNTLDLGSLLLILLYTLGLLDFSERRYDTWPWEGCAGSSPFQPSCTASRAAIAPFVQIVIKTGGSEDQSRLQHQLDSILTKVPLQNTIVLSDLEDQIDSHHVHDVYADLSVQERMSYPEFALYDKQRDYRRQEKSPRGLQGGWNLSKYMNLAMKRKIWKMRQDPGNDRMAPMKWFVFLETDTYIEWDNLLGLLEHLDPAKKLYLGSPVWLPGLQFAHGGSAYVLSYAALEALNKRTSNDLDTTFHSQYGLNTSNLCCGDEALARVLQSKGVNLNGYWPMFNGEIPATVSFGKEAWCEPVISLHHISGRDMELFWQWVEDWKTMTQGTEPFLFQDLFEYVAPQIPTSREDWDSMEGGVMLQPQIRASPSLQQCREECEKDKLCLQFVYDGSTCTLGHQIRLGRKRMPEDNGARRFVSEWNLDRIREWTTKNNCNSAHWLRSNP